MKVLTTIEAMQALAKALNKYCMFIGFDDDNFDEINKAAPYLDLYSHGQVFVDGNAILVFDSQQEMKDHYQLTVGDDGPTGANPYDGSARVYALTCGPDGELLSENT